MMQAVTRLLFCFGGGLLTFIILFLEKVEIFTRIVISWDVFGLMMITMCWRLFFSISPQQMKMHAKGQDESRTIIFFLVLASVIVSLMGILILLNTKTKGLVNSHIHAPVSIIGVAISWILLHTIFTLRYAHVYFGDEIEDNDPSTLGYGILFPGEKDPDYLDFAYFSFVIGMTFQVSDTSVMSRRIRRSVLFHSLLSFVYNTIIVALTISLLINLV